MRTVYTPIASQPLDHAPIVTVVTVALNAGKSLKFTMDSVLTQTYPSIEYIVIDGGSVDGGVSLIEAYSDRLAYWISEPDSGTYDAMNKGLQHAKGEWIIFMNAGDSFASPHVVEKVMRNSNDNVEFIYGDVEQIVGDDRRRISARPLDLMWQRISFSHQSLFSRTELMKSNPFECSYRVVADYEFYFKMYSLGARFRYLPFVISSVCPYGFSRDMAWQRTIERWQVARTYRNRLGTDLYYLKHIIRHIIPEIAHGVLRRFGCSRMLARRLPRCASGRTTQ